LKKHAKTNCIRKFTLIEVLVAMLIFGLSFSLMLQMLDSARTRIVRAGQRWSKRHLVEQATEFFLLAGVNETAPEKLLPEGLRATAQFLTDTSALPPECRNPIHGWMPTTVIVHVLDENNNIIATQKIDKIIFDKI